MRRISGLKLEGISAMPTDLGDLSQSGKAQEASGNTTDRAGIGGHPAGLTTLFLTEMWERFSYYGMRALLVLYIVEPAGGGGLGFDVAKATRIYGIYTGAVYFTNIFGGLLADSLLGARLAVLLGGIIIACGHFSLALQALPSFYVGLFLIVIGTGLLKPNISVMVGKLYREDDPRRDSGFSIFYMGINGSDDRPAHLRLHRPADQLALRLCDGWGRDDLGLNPICFASQAPGSRRGTPDKKGISW